MNFRYPAILAILIVLTAMAVAGCTILNPSSPAATATPGGATATPTGATATPAAGTSGVKLFDMGGFHWFEYKMTASGMDMTMKIEYLTDSFGGVSNARHTKSTLNMGTGDQAMVTVTDEYYNPTTNKLLGGHTKATMGGQVLVDKDIDPSDSNYGKSDYAGQASMSVPVPAGVESVTVPKGTYPAAAKYTITTGGSTVSYWIAPGVPVPIQMTMASSGGSTSMTMQLVDYG